MHHHTLGNDAKDDLQQLELDYLIHHNYVIEGMNVVYHKSECKSNTMGH